MSSPITPEESTPDSPELLKFTTERVTTTFWVLTCFGSFLCGTLAFATGLIVGPAKVGFLAGGLIAIGSGIIGVLAGFPLSFAATLCFIRLNRENLKKSCRSLYAEENRQNQSNAIAKAQLDILNKIRDISNNPSAN